MHTIFTDTLGLRRMASDCPEDRLGICWMWRKLHLNCLVSRCFEIITKQLSENIIIFTPSVLEEKRFLVEAILRLRYQSKYFDDQITHERKPEHQEDPCIKCFQYKMMILYYIKQVEIEHSNGQYWNKFCIPVNERAPLDQTILRYTFIDWHLVIFMTSIKRKNEEIEKKKY